ncbi:hypothetical protein HORIV_21340 [Vreelandella olivaria]|uniref:Uncharacterized protein n=1 Tax=Vreelandella olivaria TaxID=390919 RepID=A0ABM8HNF3_9GAMM|nr:hypothetical protein HORIV_21340 [Halomonas olivaria]
MTNLRVGAQLAITKQLSLRGRFTRYFDAGETDNLPGFDLDVISAGLPGSGNATANVYKHLP